MKVLIFLLFVLFLSGKSEKRTYAETGLDQEHLWIKT
jgi:hypothetical protein